MTLLWIAILLQSLALGACLMCIKNLQKAVQEQIKVNDLQISVNENVEKFMGVVTRMFVGGSK